MLFSLRWLRELSPVDAPPTALAAALTARGLTVDAVLSEEDDTVLDVDVPANRPDCLGHVGIARELAAAYGTPLLPRRKAKAPTGPPVDRGVRVEIESPERCARYTARLVRGVRVGPSPAEVVRRLRLVGLHSINNVVDASNLVLLELGHPIHFFDLSRIHEATIRIRGARPGETLTTLDGVPRTLDPEMLVIADPRGPVALAGVIGGLDSQIVPGTRDVLVEAASFEPRSVRRTARRLGLATEASHRFERGVDPESAQDAQDLAALLLAELAGGEPSAGVVDSYPGRTGPKRVRLRPERVRRVLGYDPGADGIERSLRALGISAILAPRGDFEVTVPTFRLDLEREDDLVEEVARHLGYDRIPARIPVQEAAPFESDPVHDAQERAREALARLGFAEAFCYSMVAQGDDAPFVTPGSAPGLALVNPIAETMSSLRQSLVAGLVRAVDQNLRHGIRDVRLFEVGRVFLPAPDRRSFPHESLRVGIAWCGAQASGHWSVKNAPVRLHDIAGVVEDLVAAVRPGAALARGTPAADTLPGGLHPRRSAAWTARDAGGREVAWCGVLHPELAGSLDLDAEVLVAEVDLDRLGAVAAAPFQFAAIPKVPAVTRDLSLVLGEAVHYARVLELLVAVEGPAPVTFEVTDRYSGPPLAAGEVSLTVRGILQPFERTLTDAETEEYRARLVLALKANAGVRLRE